MGRRRRRVLARLADGGWKHFELVLRERNRRELRGTRGAGPMEPTRKRENTQTNRRTTAQAGKQTDKQTNKQSRKREDKQTKTKQTNAQAGKQRKPKPTRSRSRSLHRRAGAEAQRSARLSALRLCAQAKPPTRARARTTEQNKRSQRIDPVTAQAIGQPGAARRRPKPHLRAREQPRGDGREVVLRQIALLDLRRARHLRARTPGIYMTICNYM